LLAHVKVARFDFALCAFDAACDDTRFNRFAFRHFQTIHDGLDALTCKDAHKRVIQAQIKA